MLRAALLSLGAAGVLGAQVTPVQKVITLLQDLKAQVVEEGKTEAGTYDKFACFCKDTTEEKSTAIKDGQDEIDSLSAEIVKKTAEKEAAQAKLKADVADKLAKEADLKDTIAKFQKYKAAYQAQNADEEKAMYSLKNAIGAMKKSKPSLAEMKAVIRKNVMVAEMLGLDSAKKASAFLQTTVDPSDPEYKFHSDGIISMLQDLFKEFKTKNEALDEEFDKTKKAYKEMRASLEKTIEALAKSIKNGKETISDLSTAIGAARADLVEEDAMLKDNKTYLADLTERCEKRAQDWDQRSSMRKGEIEALTTALKIMENVETQKTAGADARAFLNQQKVVVQKVEDSDFDARDDAMVFTQTRMSVAKLMAKRSKTQRAVSTLKEAAKKLGGSFSLDKAAAAVAADPFKKVKTLIQDLIERLVKEATAEATKKGFCDTEMGKAERERDFKKDALTTLNAELAVLEAKRDTLKSDIATAKTKLDETTKALAEATEIREEEHKENTLTIKDAKDGHAAVTEALQVLKDFYLGKNNAGGANTATVTYSMLQQGPVGEDAPEVAADAYQGAQGSAKNILGMLEVIATDFDRTARQTAEAEKQAQAEFVLFKRESKSLISSLETELELNTSDLEQTKTTINTKMDDLQTTQHLLDSALKTLEELKPMCVDMTMSYEERVAKREAEIEALKTALCQLDPDDVEAECSA